MNMHKGDLTYVAHGMTARMLRGRLILLSSKPHLLQHAGQVNLHNLVPAPLRAPGNALLIELGLFYQALQQRAVFGHAWICVELHVVNRRHLREQTSQQPNAVLGIEVIPDAPALKDLVRCRVNLYKDLQLVHLLHRCQSQPAIHDPAFRRFREARPQSQL